MSPAPRALAAFAQLARRRGFEELSAMGLFDEALALGPESCARAAAKLWARASPAELSRALRGPLRGAEASVASRLWGADRDDMERARALGAAGALPDPEASRRWGRLARSGAASWRFVVGLLAEGLAGRGELARGNATSAARVALGCLERDGALRGPLARSQAKFLMRALSVDAEAVRSECLGAWLASSRDPVAFEALWCSRAEPVALRSELRALRRGGRPAAAGPRRAERSGRL